MQQPMIKEKLRKAGFCLITSCFIKPFKSIINCFFLFLKLIGSATFAFWYQGHENWDRQIARNGKLNIYFKNNSNLLVMNVTQFNFLTDNVWRFIKVNLKRHFLFIIVPTLISWSKTKFFTDYNDKI